MGVSLCIEQALSETVEQQFFLGFHQAPQLNACDETERIRLTSRTSSSLGRSDITAETHRRATELQTDPTKGGSSVEVHELGNDDDVNLFDLLGALSNFFREVVVCVIR